MDHHQAVPQDRVRQRRAAARRVGGRRCDAHAPRRVVERLDESARDIETHETLERVPLRHRDVHERQRRRFQPREFEPAQRDAHGPHEATLAGRFARAFLGPAPVRREAERARALGGHDRRRRPGVE